MMRINFIDTIALILLIVGGLNWGLIGLFNFDLVATLFGTMTVVTKAVYTIVGVAALYNIYLLVKLNTKP